MLDGLVIITYSQADFRQVIMPISPSVTRGNAAPPSEECYELHEMTEPRVKYYQPLPGSWGM